MEVIIHLCHTYGDDSNESYRAQSEPYDWKLPIPRKGDLISLDWSTILKFDWCDRDTESALKEIVLPFELMEFEFDGDNEPTINFHFGDLWSQE